MIYWEKGENVIVWDGHLKQVKADKDGKIKKGNKDQVCYWKQVQLWVMLILPYQQSLWYDWSNCIIKTEIAKVIKK